MGYMKRALSSNVLLFLEALTLMEGWGGKDVDFTQCSVLTRVASDGRVFSIPYEIYMKPSLRIVFLDVVIKVTNNVV